MQFLVIGLAFGDCGKGSIVDAITRKYKASCVIRFNGGSNAGHNVVEPSGRHHCFSQFGSGTLVDGCQTFLSKHVLINPLSMVEENKVLQSKGVYDALARMHIDERALVTTPYHRALSRIQELARGDGRHGSCGKGIGATMEHFTECREGAIRVRDLHHSNELKSKLQKVKHWAYGKVIKLMPIGKSELLSQEFSTFDVPFERVDEEFRRFSECVKILTPHSSETFLKSHPIRVFEGAQGVLLDERFPLGTWSKTTAVNADEVIEEFHLDGPRKEIGVTRVYATMHAAGFTFPTQDNNLRNKLLLKEHNQFNEWQREFRVGNINMANLKLAVSMCPKLDGLAITHTDKLHDLNADNFGIESICDQTGKPMLIESFGPTWKDKSFYL